MSKNRLFSRRWGLPAFLGLVASLPLPLPTAWAFDCAKAASSIEKTICAKPQLKAVDGSMSEAYAALWKGYDEAERKAMSTLQRKWLKTERDVCANRKGVDVISCLLSRIQKRRRLLAGEPESGPGTGALMIPVFRQQDSDDASNVAIDVELLKFTNPQSTGENLFNAEISKRGEELPFGRKIESSVHLTININLVLTYASPKFLSARIATREIDGAVHDRVDNINIDLVRGVELKIGDWFDEKAIDELKNRCRAQVIAVKLAGDHTYKPEDDKIYTEKMILDAVKRARNWAFSKDMISITFDTRRDQQGRGPIGCSFLANDIRLLAKPGFFTHDY